MLIHNYGLFWRADRVFWGRPNNPGHLWGYSVNSQQRESDFREQIGLYVLYDSSFNMVYVGQAGANDKHNLFLRLKDHRNDQLAERWSRFSWFGLLAVNQDGSLRKPSQKKQPTIGEVLNHIEAILITASEPAHNRQGGRFGDKVEQFLQWKDPDNVGPEPEELIKEIHTAVVNQG